MGVVSGCGFRRWVWLVGGIYGCGYQEVGVVSECCCKKVYKFPHNITFPYSTCTSSFFAAASLFFIHFKMLFHSLYIII